MRSDPLSYNCLNSVTRDFHKCKMTQDLSRMNVMGDGNKIKLQMLIINDFAKYLGRVNADI